MVTVAEVLRAELDVLLSESVDDAAQRARTTFDTSARIFGRRFVISGAGNLGRKVLTALRSEGIEPLAFVDQNPMLWGASLNGVRILPPAEGSKLYGESATFCVAIWRGEGTDTMSERRQPLMDGGCLNVIDFGALFWKHGTDLLPHYSLDLPQHVLTAAGAVRACFDLWSDDASRAEYVAQVRWRLHLDFDNLPPPVKQDIYFPFDLVALSADEVFVDCGAYDGDTVRDFVRHSAGHFKVICAFEADAQNFKKLLQFVAGLPGDLGGRIALMEAAVSDKQGHLRFASSGNASSSVSESGELVRSVMLDSALETAPTWIKMDIEGSEPAALRGAAKTIVDHAPVLSVCVYHAQDHLWRIPLQIAAMRRDYGLFLRPFVPESWDLVCYAIPNDRRPP